ncbi:MAG TPA: SOS response-associated peptidase [Aquihabitans sp.]|jgi:putative SOS response-associated peptidase YedK|nr:SOS response-associated peptidase [Aquihabitans sp.]
MCGRFVSSSPPDEIARYFDADAPVAEPPVPRWNVAPTDDVYVVRADGTTRRLDRFHWGLVPFWATSPKVGARMINARAEGLAEKGAFKHAFRTRRCIVPADGFYEWQKVPGQRAKQPYFVHRTDDEPLAFAGLWETWRNRDDEAAGTLRSTTIVTTSANETVAPIHDRMPVILPASAWDQWLDPANDDLEALGRLLVPAPPRLLELRPVGPEVGNVRNDGPQLVEAVPTVEGGTLFT